MKTPRWQVAATLAKKSLAGDIDEKRFSQEVAAYLLEAGRTGELDSLLRDIVRYRAEHGIVEVTAVSAHELPATAQAEITSQAKALYPTARQIIINQQHKPSLLGGVRLELIDKQLDLSIRNKLNNLKAMTTQERTS